MKIYVDADACPVKQQIVQVAGEVGVHVTMVMSISHWSPEIGTVEVVYVDNQSQAVDIYVMNRLQKGDILVTQDYGLAAVALAKQCFALSPRGREYTNENMDSLLMRKHNEGKIRRGGGRHRGMPAYTEKDRDRFVQNLRRLLAVVSSSSPE